jgi:valyl-tRNA synthetase
MPHELPKAYDPAAIEDHWAEYWVRENLFSQPAPTDASGQKAFTVLLPPPNVTGNLHMGHMFEHTESDILVRWRRMSGDPVLWIPGTDHAGIATQMLVERQLATEGTSRQQLGREAFVERVWEWRRHYGGTILGQMKRLGESVDWQREYFTMDDNLSVAVREAFVRLYEQELIYRGAYIVNWCPGCQTAISDLEVVHSEQKGHLWEIRYPVVDDAGKETGEFLTVATTRPETMLGDTAVAIHPEDERYLHLHGKKLRLPLMGREIPIVLDEWVSRDFGTGAVKVTPAHDPNDFALGQRHNLPSINIMDDTGHINAEGGAYAGLDRYVARKKVVADLEEQGLLGAVKEHTNNVGHCDRCKTVVEPRLSTQWFIAVNKKAQDRGASMAELAIAAVMPGPDGKKAIRILPEQYEKVYLDWMTNIHDWCISRQLWWGHRIPAWHCGTCRKITVARVDPTACAHCGAATLTQETDVLDTWFSSGLLPVSVFGWPHIDAKTKAAFDAFYPTSLLVTGFDILFFWVARMIMFGCWFSPDVPLSDGSPRPLAESVPFREVWIHALVLDANREKMSKTKGNVVDPIEIVKQYGTDAVRFTLASMASPGTNVAFNIARTEGYRAFANKIWNAARFIFMNVDRAAEVGIKVDPAVLGRMPIVPDDSPLEARWIVAELQSTALLVNQALENFRFDDAANLIYQFFWGNFCDWYLEIVKLRLDFSETAESAKTKAALTTLVSVFETALCLLSPFMPFLTEELWHAVYDGNPPAKSIALTSYPVAGDDPSLSPILSGTALDMKYLQELIGGVRFARKERQIPEKVAVRIVLQTNTQRAESVLRENAPLVSRLARVEEIRFSNEPLQGNAFRYVAGGVQFEWQFDGSDFERTVDFSAERERLAKEIKRLEKIIESSDRQLNNPGFLAKAPEHIVEGLKKQRGEAKRLLDKARGDLDALPPEA